ncbi:F-box-like protein [Ceratobasidium sp. AG-Ba]|nr:F-box-like protein [Ceratobasidium sp. AG-Ba]
MHIVELPPEITSAIFLANGCNNSCRAGVSRLGQGCVHPTTLASVCRSWRDTALGLPWLWSLIHVKTKGVDPAPGQDEYLHIQYERSAGVSVHLVIQVRDDTTSSAQTGEENGKHYGNYWPQLSLELTELKYALIRTAQPA